MSAHKLSSKQATAMVNAIREILGLAPIAGTTDLFKPDEIAADEIAADNWSENDIAWTSPSSEPDCSDFYFQGEFRPQENPMRRSSGNAARPRVRRIRSPGG